MHRILPLDPNDMPLYGVPFESLLELRLSCGVVNSSRYVVVAINTFD
jgi:hypothetical protein